MQADRRALARRRREGRVVFLEDYDIDLARAIIPGCDIWLNTPRRPLRGLRDERDEGGRERRPQPLGARRLVGRGVRRRRTAGRSTASPTRPTPSSSTACSRSEVVPRFAGAGRLARDDEGLDRRARAALLDAAHGDRVRRALLRARSGATLDLVQAATAARARRRAARAAPRHSGARPQVLPVAPEPLDELLAVREPAAPEAVVMMMSTHVHPPPFAFSTIIVI